MPSRKSGQMRSQTTPFPEMPHQVPGGVLGGVSLVNGQALPAGRFLSLGLCQALGPEGCFLLPEPRGHEVIKKE